MREFDPGVTQETILTDEEKEQLGILVVQQEITWSEQEVTDLLKRIGDET